MFILHWSCQLGRAWTRNIFIISSFCSLGLSRYPGCHYKYKYNLLLWQRETAKGASGSAREGRPPLCCPFWSLWWSQGGAHMDEHGDQVSAWYRVVWQPASLSSLALAMPRFSQKNPFSLFPPSNLLHPLGHASGRVLESGEDNVRDQSRLWGKCGVFFCFPVLFSSWISFLGWLTDTLYGQVCVRRDFPQCWHRMRCGEMQECQEPATLLNKTPHPHILAQVAGAASGEMEPKCLQQALD